MTLYDDDMPPFLMRLFYYSVHGFCHARDRLTRLSTFVLFSSTNSLHLDPGTAPYAVDCFPLSLTTRQKLKTRREIKDKIK
jgi:hypothetical protein